VNRSTKVFDKSAFVYDEDRDCCFCPAGKTLSRRGQETKQRGDRKVVQINYRSDACAGCPLCRRRSETRFSRCASPKPPPVESVCSIPVA